MAPDRYVPVGSYTFRVNVTDSDSLFSGLVNLEEALEVLPNLAEAPNILSATAGDGLVDLEWRAPHNTGDLPVDGFRVLRGTSQGDLVVIITTDAFADTYQDTGLTNGLTYFYALVAYNDLGDSPWSDILNATPMGVPGVPIDLSVTPGDGDVTVRWSPPVLDGGSPVLGYRVFRGVFDGPLEEIAVVGVVTEHLDEGLTNGQEYFYSVLAFNDEGDGPQAISLPAIPVGRPGAPTGVLIDVAVMSLTLSWGAPVDTGGTIITGFIIFRGPSEDDLEFLEAMPASTSQYIDDDLTAGERYHYAVAAETIAGEGPLSPVVSAVAVDIPGIPDDLEGEAGDSEVSLTWTVPFNGGSAITG
ncbi:MAG: fibronectin type III domain-containing protein, partial [Thermoplasmata archaeon]|nr:fibronectin type III domain-containing protein [Thermoplasmata archaeon]